MPVVGTRTDLTALSSSQDRYQPPRGTWFDGSNTSPPALGALCPLPQRCTGATARSSPAAVTRPSVRLYFVSRSTKPSETVAAAAGEPPGGPGGDGRLTGGPTPSAAPPRGRGPAPGTFCAVPGAGHPRRAGRGGPRAELAGHNGRARSGDGAGGRFPCRARADGGPASPLPAPPAGAGRRLQPGHGQRDQLERGDGQPLRLLPGHAPAAAAAGETAVSAPRPARPRPGPPAGTLLPSTAGKLPLAAGRGRQPPRGVRPAAGMRQGRRRLSEGWAAPAAGRCGAGAAPSGGAVRRSERPRPGTCAEPRLERGSERQPPLGALPAAALSCAGRAGRLQPAAAVICAAGASAALGSVLRGMPGLG